MQGLAEGAAHLCSSPGPQAGCMQTAQRHAEFPAVACVTLQATGNYSLFSRLERYGKIIPSPKHKIIDGWCSMPVAGKMPLAVLTSITP